MVQFRVKPYYEHLQSKSLMIYESGKRGQKQLFGLTGRLRGKLFICTKEDFRTGFKKVNKSEVKEYFERDKDRPKARVILPNK